MSPGFDFSTSSLLCQEEDYTLLSDGECLDSTCHNLGRRSSRPVDEFNGGDGSIGLMVQSDECVLEMVKKEIEHLCETDYFSRLRNGDFDLVSRIEAIHWMTKDYTEVKDLTNSFCKSVVTIVVTVNLLERVKNVIAHYNFGPLCAYLAVSYLDRFLSAYNLPKGQAWMLQLLAVACLSLAAKMDENEVPLTLDLQVAKSKYIFEAKTIQKMEIMVLSKLNWRMQAITPFSFIDHFLYKLNGETPPPKSAITLSTQLILSIIRGIEYLEYRPSEIAAAVAVSVGLETQTVEVDKSMHLLVEYVKKDRVLKCMEMIHESSLRRGPDEGLNGNITPCVPHSPMGVLDVTCLSYKSDETTFESCANSSHISLGTKRRKLLV